MNQLKCRFCFMGILLLACFLLTSCGEKTKNKKEKAVKMTNIHLNDYTAETPMIISHRGSPIDFPEHSFAGYDDAIKKGSKFIEQDIILSSDNLPVVSHDNNLKRIMNKETNISNTDYSDLVKFSLKNGESLHTIDQIFKKYGKNIFYVIETKYSPKKDFTMEKKIIKAIKTYGLTKNVILQSFDLKSLNYMNDHLPNTPIMLLIDEVSKEKALEIINKTPNYVDIITIPDTLMTEKIVKEIKEKGKRAMAYTLNNEQQFQLAKEIKLQGYFTNNTKKAIDFNKKK